MPGKHFTVAAGEQLLNHHVELVRLEMVQLYGPGGTFRNAYSAAHTFRGLDLSFAVLVAERSRIRAECNAGHTGYALLLVNIRNLCADVELRL